MYEQLNFSPEAVSKNVPLTLENFQKRANSKPEYRHLMMRPDIFYLALTWPHMRVTQTLPTQAPVRLPRSTMSSTTTSAVSGAAPVLRSLRPQRAAFVSASTLSNVPVIRFQGQQGTVRMLRPVNPPSFHLRQGLPSPQLRQALTTPQTRLVLRTAPPSQPQSLPAAPVIVSVASLAPSSTMVSPKDVFLCPGFPHRCSDGSLKTRSNMIDHWTIVHSYNIIDKTVSTLQKNLG